MRIIETRIDINSGTVDGSEGLIQYRYDALLFVQRRQRNENFTNYTKS